MRRLTAIFALALVATSVLAPATSAASVAPTVSAASAATALASSVSAAAGTVSVTTPSSATATTPVATPSTAAALGPKVAIIAGPVGDPGTAQYEGYADTVYNEAVKWTNNVVKVYSPDATWPKVVAAVTGASIVVYIGHGNGWPAPYPWDPNFTGRDGFGLNYDVNGDGKLNNYEMRYYGEPYIRTLKMAPGAIVLLFHLCYAAGNPEPGGPDPTLSVATQRADNFASAFLAAGAKAVLAIGHSNDPYYIRSLFTTDQTLVSYFLHAPDFKNHVMGFTSARTPGAVELLDPDTTAPTGFFRAYTGSSTARTTGVTGGAWIPTNIDPATMQVPGKATPVADGTPVYGSPADAANAVNPTTSLPASQVLRVNSVVSGVTSVANGSPIYDVAWGASEGWMPGASLTPRDSTPPRVWAVNDGTGAFSPNGDGSGDTFPLSIRLSEPASWTLKIEDAGGTPLASNAGSGDTASITWAPAPASVSDGTYRWHLTATDPMGNGPLDTTGPITVDRTAPILTVDGDASTPRGLSPNGDGVADTVGLRVASNKPGTATATIRNSSSTVVVTLNTAFVWRDGVIIWDGRDTGGTIVPDGTYTASIVTTDPAGNTSAPQTRILQVYAALGFAATAPALFFPQDGDGLAATTNFSFKLASPATVTWTIVNDAGAVVRTVKTAEALAAGPYTFAWDGHNDANAFVPRGTYRSVVTATNGTLSATLSSSVLADAFRFAVSTSTPKRSSYLTVTVTTAEPLSSAVRLYIVEPGIATYGYGMVRINATQYRATVWLRYSNVGTLRLKAQATDSGGQFQFANLTLPLH